MAAIGLGVIVSSLGLLAAAIGGDPSWGLLAAFLIVAWLHDFVLPTRFRVDRDGVVARGGLFSRSFAWRDATRLVIDDRGGWLGRARGSRWRRRGISIFWSPRTGHGDALLAMASEFAPTVECRDLRATSSARPAAASPDRSEPVYADSEASR